MKIRLEGDVKEHEYYKKLTKSHDRQIAIMKEKGFYKEQLENNFPIMLLKRV